MMKLTRQQALTILLVAIGIIFLIASVLLIVRNGQKTGQPAAPGQLAEGALTGLPTGRTFAETATPSPTSEAVKVELTATAGAAATLAGATAGPSPTANPNITPMVTHSGESYDSHETVYENLLTSGAAVEGVVINPFDAHNYYYDGEAGEEVTITVVGDGTTDPRVTLLSPNGSFLAENDDSSFSLNSSLSAILPMDGRYTIRVTVWVVGPYTLTLTVE